MLTKKNTQINQLIPIIWKSNFWVLHKLDIGSLQILTKRARKKKRMLRIFMLIRNIYLAIKLSKDSDHS